MKKIMFNDRYGLTDAVLNGRKTMTRRIVPNGTPLGNWEETENTLCYKTGDVVAVAQSYKDIGLSFIQPPDPQWGCTEQMSGYGNKMFVRADLMPHKIRITDIRIERLQDISDEDCLKEGIVEDYKGVQYAFPTNVGYFGQYPFDTARGAFAALIDKVSGKGTWDSNPFVFAYSFELEK